jgi:pyruvate,water dikinase
VGEEFQIVQSRPITTLFPVPVTDDGENHLYVSVGHQQMMTDAMKPLGLAFWQLTTPRPMAEAGGRLFVDVAPILATPAGRARMLDLARSDPLIGDALQTVIDRGDFLPSRPDEEAVVPLAGSGQAPIEADPALVAEFVERSRASPRRARARHTHPLRTGAVRLHPGRHR